MTRNKYLVYNIFRKAAQLVHDALLTSLWLLSSVFPATKEEMRRKFSFIWEMMKKIGMLLFDDTIQRLVDEFFKQIPDLK